MRSPSSPPRGIARPFGAPSPAVGQIALASHRRTRRSRTPRPAPGGADVPSTAYCLRNGIGRAASRAEGVPLAAGRSRRPPARVTDRRATSRVDSHSGGRSKGKRRAPFLALEPAQTYDPRRSPVVRKCDIVGRKWHIRRVSLHAEGPFWIPLRL